MFARVADDGTWPVRSTRRKLTPGMVGPTPGGTWRWVVREAFAGWFMAQSNTQGYHCTEETAIAEWCTRCRSEDIVKGVDDNGDLCIKVFNVAKTWPHLRPGGFHVYPIVFPDSCMAPYEDLVTDIAKFVIGSI